MTTLTPAARDVLLIDAREDAAQRAAAAEAEASATLRDARRQAEDLLEEARAEGERLGRADAVRAEERARVEARSTELAARREAYDALRRRAWESALALRVDRDYPALLTRLEAAARADLGGDGVEVDVDPPDAGGVRARAGSRHVDYTLVGLADRCLDALGPKIGGLWR